MGATEWDEHPVLGRSASHIPVQSSPVASARRADVFAHLAYRSEIRLSYVTVAPHDTLEHFTGAVAVAAANWCEEEEALLARACIVTSQ